MIHSKGYTLIELMVAIGLFAIIMLLVSGAYFIMISLNQQTQGLATGINNLSFALETMTRGIRTGSNYNCGGSGDCTSGANSFSFKNENGIAISYSLVASALQETRNGVPSALTDPSVTVTSLTFYVFGTKSIAQGDYQQPHVTLTISGTVSSGPGKVQSFTVESGATMRGPDI